MKIVVELIFVAILAMSVWSAYKKGLVMTIGSILIIIIAMFLGDLLSDAFSHEAMPVLRPFVAGYMEGEDGVIDEAIAEATGNSSEMLSADDIIEMLPEIRPEVCKLSFMKMGVYESSAEVMAERTITYHDQSGTSIGSSIVEIMCQSITYYIGFILFFAVIVILLTVLGNISNLSFKIPNMDKLNNIGGAVAGLVVGFLFCSFAAWVLKLTGRLLPEEELPSFLSKLFVNINFLSKFLTI